MMGSLLILGARSEFTGLVEEATKRGLRTVVCDGNPDTPAKRAADVSYDIDPRDTDRLLEVIEQEEVTAIQTAYSDVLMESVVRVASKAGLPCHLTVDQLPFYRDKWVMEETCRKIGAAVPLTRRLASAEDGIVPDRFPCILKPVDAYGSRGIQVIYDKDELQDALANASFPLLMQEYEDAPEYNLQCYVHNGKVVPLGLCDREKTWFEREHIPYSTRNVYPANGIEKILPDAARILQDYIGITAQTEGPLCMQFYYAPEKGVVVGEITARFLGYEHELLSFVSGIRTEDLLLDAVTDEEALCARLTGVDPIQETCAAVIYFHGRDGVIADTTFDAVCAMSGVTFGQSFYRIGERIGSPQTRPYVARFYVCGQDRAAVDALTNQVREAFAVTDEHGASLLLS